VSRDLDTILKDWELKPGTIQARLVQARDGRQVLQLRLDLGLLQLETTGRPDGVRPHGFETYYDYLKQQALQAKRSGGAFQLSEEQCFEADREFIQFYHRRISWLAVHQFQRAIEDADHTLAFMDFVRDHAANEEYSQLHERYRAFVMFHRTQAAAARAIENKDPEGAIDEIRSGLQKIKEYYAASGVEEQLEEDALVQQLRQMEQSLRQSHSIAETLREQLDRAVANEEYEIAARIRDQLRRRQ